MKKGNKKTGLIVLAVALTTLIIACTVLGIIYIPKILNYYEKAVPETKLFPPPDAITLYYVKDGEMQKKELSREEADLVYNAFMELTLYYNSEAQRDSNQFWGGGSGPPKELNMEQFWNSFAVAGGLEFHYDQRRDFHVGLVNKDELGRPIGIFSTSGEADSVFITGVLFLDRYSPYWLEFAFCRNGNFSGDNDSATFDKEKATEFWNVVATCYPQ